jgi:hypothetical protein
MPGDRRRFGVAYLGSILIHAIALVLLAAFVLRALIEGGLQRSESRAAADDAAARRRAIRAALARSERGTLSRAGSPNGSSHRPTARPTIIAPTAAPTVAPTLPPMPEPTVRPTAVPTAAPRAGARE